MREARILSGPFIIRVPFFYYSVLIRGSENKQGKRVLLRNLWEESVVGLRTARTSTLKPNPETLNP